MKRKITCRNIIKKLRTEEMPRISQSIPEISKIMIKIIDNQKNKIRKDIIIENKIYKKIVVLSAKNYIIAE